MPELGRLPRHLLDGGAAVGPVGVEVQIAARARRGSGAPGPESGAASASSRARYSGTSPSSACAITRAVLDPIPGRSPRRPCAANSRSSSGGRPRTASAALRNASSL